MNTTYSLRLPARILFGPGTLRQLPDELPPDSRHILLVSGNHPLRDGSADALLQSLYNSGRTVSTISGIPPEPSPEDVDRVIENGRACAADAVAAFGGGSVIDCAKAAAALIPAEGNCTDYFSGKKTITRKGLFFAAMPTTAGTGAEMTSNSVLTDRTNQVKKSLRSPWMTADLAIADPLPTYSCPPEVTASSGLDAFVQAAESYTNPKGCEFSRLLALQALKKIVSRLETAYRSPSDETARSAMMEGSMLAGMSFAQCGLGAVHGLAHPLGSLLKVPHGTACAILMTPVFTFNLSAAGKRYAEIARALGLAKPDETDENAAKNFLALATHLAEHLRIPRSFAVFGLTQKHFPFILENCRSASMRSNPAEMSDQDVLTLLEKLL